VVERGDLRVVLEHVLVRVVVESEPILVLGRVGGLREPRGHLAVREGRDGRRTDDEDDVRVRCLHLVAPVRERILDPPRLEVDEFSVVRVRVVDRWWWRPPLLCAPGILQR
jgi:hypothetical protein